MPQADYRGGFTAPEGRFRQVVDSDIGSRPGLPRSAGFLGMKFRFDTAGVKAEVRTVCAGPKKCPMGFGKHKPLVLRDLKASQTS